VDDAGGKEPDHGFIPPREEEVVEDGGRRILEDLLPSPDAGPDALYARGVLLAEIEAALGELPPASARSFWRTKSTGAASPRSRRKPA
jgi:hypothetical protein